LPPHNDLWMTRRTSAGWEEPHPVSAVNTFDLEESYATLTADGRMIFLKGLGNEVYDLYESRLGPDGTFSAAARSSSRPTNTAKPIRWWRRTDRT
jgi:hypothetical protein